MSDIDASGGAYGGRVQVMVGYILGIVGTILMIFVAFLFLMMLIGGNA